MRRMNYDRFAKPVNFGEWDSDNERFVLDNDIEEGFYWGLVKTPNGVGSYNENSFVMRVSGYVAASDTYIAIDSQNLEYISYYSDEKKHLYAKDADGEPAAHDEGTIIELYKLD